MIRRTLLVIVIALVGALLLAYQNDIPVEILIDQYGQAPSQYMEIDGMPVHYRVEGEGMPLVLIHGTAASLHTWDGWAKELSSDFKVVRFDLPAFGLTGPSPEANYSLDFYASFVDKVLLRLNIDSCYMAGNSLGGAISWYYATQYPAKVKKLVLVDASGHPRQGNQPIIFRLAQQPAFAAFFKYFTPRFVIENNLKAVYYDDTKITEDLVDRYFSMALREGNRQAFIDRANTKFDSKSELIKSLKLPTLILWGQHDEWVPLSDAYLFEDEIKNSELIIYSTAGHVPMEEIPVRSALDTRSFLIN